MLFRKKKIDEVENSDWRDLNALPQEIISKKELDQLQKETLEEIEKLQKDAVIEYKEKATAKPQTLFYYHKYINTKFNKNGSMINRYYSKKQNVVDKKYANGLGDIRAEFTGYKELIEEIKEVETRLKKKINKLDPTSDVDVSKPGTYDDSNDILEMINSLPKTIDWEHIS